MWDFQRAAREAMVYLPATAKMSPSPVAFAFHDQAGTTEISANKFAYLLWAAREDVFAAVAPRVVAAKPETVAMPSKTGQIRAAEIPACVSDARPANVQRCVCCGTSSMSSDPPFRSRFPTGPRWTVPTSEQVGQSLGKAIACASGGR